MDYSKDHLCDYCDQAEATLVCQECFQGMWCSERCHQMDAADHEEYDCYHPDDLSDACVLEEVEYETHDPVEARQIMKEMIGADLMDIGLLNRSGSTRRRRAMRRERRRARKRRRKLRRERMRLKKQKRKLAKERRERRRLQRARDAETREARRVRKQREALDAAERKTLRQQGVTAPEEMPDATVYPEDEYLMDDTESSAAHIASFFV